MATISVWMVFIIQISDGYNEVDIFYVENYLLLR